VDLSAATLISTPGATLPSIFTFGPPGGHDQ
jgi:hypothetical protein